MMLLFVALPFALSACSGGTSGTEEPMPSVTSTAPSATPSTPSASRSAPASPDAAVVRWLGSFCAARNPLDTALSSASFPQVPENTTEANRSEAIAFLTKARDGIERSNVLLAGVGKAPVPGGDEAVAAAGRDTEKLRRSMDTYLSNVKRFPAAEIGSPLRLALVELATASPFNGLYALADKDPTVAAAYKQVPECT